MSTSNRQFNDRKRKLSLLKRTMAKQGYEFKKAVRNTITFRHLETGDKKRMDLTAVA